MDTISTGPSGTVEEELTVLDMKDFDKDFILSLKQGALSECDFDRHLVCVLLRKISEEPATVQPMTLAEVLTDGDRLSYHKGAPASSLSCPNTAATVLHGSHSADHRPQRLHGGHSAVRIQQPQCCFTATVLTIGHSASPAATVLSGHSSHSVAWQPQC